MSNLAPKRCTNVEYRVSIDEDLTYDKKGFASKLESLVMLKRCKKYSQGYAKGMQRHTIKKGKTKR